MEKLKDKVEEFANIAKTLPENLQATCFELLLRHHLESLGSHNRSHGKDTPPPPEFDPANPSTDTTDDDFVGS